MGSPLFFTSDLPKTMVIKGNKTKIQSILLTYWYFYA